MCNDMHCGMGYDRSMIRRWTGREEAWRLGVIDATAKVSKTCPPAIGSFVQRKNLEPILNFGAFFPRVFEGSS